MNKKNKANNFNVDDHTWRFAYDAIGESVYNSIISSVRIISTSLWDFGWDAVDVGVDTSLRDDVWQSANDYFQQK
jgi:hypothetical protein